MTEAPFVFKNVRGGQPIAPSEFPKMPLAGVLALLEATAENGLDPTAKNFVASSYRMGAEVVAAVLGRLQPGLSAKKLIEDEDFEELMRAYELIQVQNPAVFPRAPAGTEAKASPKSVAPA